MKNQNIFIPHTHIYASYCVKNSADVYDALCKASQLNPEMSGKHIGLRFPAAMECEIHFRLGDEHITYKVMPLFMRDRRIYDVHGCEMCQPDVVIAPMQRFGYVTLYTLDTSENFGIKASFTIAFKDTVSVFLKKPKTEPSKQSWYKRLFS